MYFTADIISNDSLSELINGVINRESGACETISARKEWVSGSSGLAWTELGGLCFKSIRFPAQQPQDVWALTCSMETLRNPQVNLHHWAERQDGLPILTNTLENSCSSASQKTIQTEMICLCSLKDLWEQVFSPNNLDCTTFQGFKNWSSASNAEYYVFALWLCRAFLGKLLFLGSIKIVPDTQLDVLPLSLSVVLTALM